MHGVATYKYRTLEERELTSKDQPCCSYWGIRVHMTSKDPVAVLGCVFWDVSAMLCTACQHAPGGKLLRFPNARCCRLFRDKVVQKSS